jgi:hypothetical protein
VPFFAPTTAEYLEHDPADQHHADDYQSRQTQVTEEIRHRGPDVEGAQPDADGPDGGAERVQRLIGPRADVVDPGYPGWGQDHGDRQLAMEDAVSALEGTQAGAM